jgi:uncharacterized protein YkwD
MQRIGKIAAVTAIVAVAGPATAQACPNADAVPSELTLKSARVAVVCLMNERRGSAKLRSDARLTRAAQRHSNAMDAANFFSHNGPGGSSPTTRIRAAGYLAGAREWGIAENLRWGSGGQGTPRIAVARWMQSPAHRYSMLSRSYRDVGIGVAIGSPAGGGGGDTAIYTVNFGYRR